MGQQEGTTKRQLEERKKMDDQILNMMLLEKTKPNPYNLRRTRPLVY